MVALGKVDEFAVVLAILPIGVISGGPEPASQAAKHGIANEAGRRWQISRHGNHNNSKNQIEEVRFKEVDSGSGETIRLPVCIRLFRIRV